MLCFGFAGCWGCADVCRGCVAGLDEGGLLAGWGARGALAVPELATVALVAGSTVGPASGTAEGMADATFGGGLAASVAVFAVVPATVFGLWSPAFARPITTAPSTPPTAMAPTTAAMTPTGTRPGVDAGCAVVTVGEAVTAGDPVIDAELARLAPVAEGETGCSALVAGGSGGSATVGRVVTTCSPSASAARSA